MIKTFQKPYMERQTKPLKKNKWIETIKKR